MPRKLDFSKVADISVEDTQETSDVKLIVNDLISSKTKKVKKELQPIEKTINIVEETRALTHASMPTLEHALSHAVSESLVVGDTEKKPKPKLEFLASKAEEQNLPEVTIKDMAKWHTEAEQKVYKSMVAETQKHSSLELYFSFQQLATRTGFKNRRTIIAAISGLVAKGSIEVLVDRHGDHFGKCYRVFLPSEVLERRKRLEILIHPQTKKVV